MAQIFLAIAALLGGTSVAAGAFGSHGLRGQLSDRALEIFETAARYQMYHALALLAVGILLKLTSLAAITVLYGNTIPSGAVVTIPDKWLTLFLSLSGYAFIAGTLIFSGSLYALSISGIRWLGAIAPIGGVFLLSGWLCLAIAAFQQESG